MYTGDVPTHVQISVSSLPLIFSWKTPFVYGRSSLFWSADEAERKGTPRLTFLTCFCFSSSESCSNDFCRVYSMMPPYCEYLAVRAIRMSGY